MGPNREMHLAFQAADVEQVRAFHAAATELGRRDAARAAALAGVPRALLRRVRARPRRQQRRGRLPRRRARRLSGNCHTALVSSTARTIRVRRRSQPVRRAHAARRARRRASSSSSTAGSGRRRTTCRSAGRSPRAWPSTAGRRGTSSTAGSATAAATRPPSTTSRPRSTRCADQGLPLDRVLALGHSAGGHLGDLGRLARPLPTRWPARVELTGVVSQAGVLDLSSAYDESLGGGAVAAFLGHPPGPDDARLDPRRQIPLDVPVHCVHGRDDDTVPIEPVAATTSPRPGRPARGRADRGRRRPLRR